MPESGQPVTDTEIRDLMLAARQVRKHFARRALPAGAGRRHRCPHNRRADHHPQEEHVMTDPAAPPPARSYCTVSWHRDGQHDASCMPPADSSDPALRLLRAIFGLCSDCDRSDPHTHRYSVADLGRILGALGDAVTWAPGDAGHSRALQALIARTAEMIAEQAAEPAGGHGLHEIWQRLAEIQHRDGNVPGAELVPVVDEVLRRYGYPTDGPPDDDDDEDDGTGYVPPVICHCGVLPHPAGAVGCVSEEPQPDGTPWPVLPSLDEYQLVRMDGTVLLAQACPAGTRFAWDLRPDTIDGPCAVRGRTLPDGRWLPLAYFPHGYPGPQEPFPEDAQIGGGQRPALTDSPAAPAAGQTPERDTAQ